ncbi:MAG: hypothetical protein ACYTFG_12745, partial [Planctomycetota bacterium]
MEEHEEKKPEFTSEQGVLIPMSVVVVIALTVATLATGGSNAGPGPRWKDPIPCPFQGKLFILNLPQGVHIGDEFAEARERADEDSRDDRSASEKYGWVDRGILKFKIYRENVRMGFLDVMVSDEKKIHHHSANWESIEVAKGRGDIIFRFRHLAGDGEAGALMAKIADKIVVVIDRGER